MKAAEIGVKALLDLSRSMAGEFPTKFRYPYKTFLEPGTWTVTVGPQLSSDGYERRGEQIWTHKSAKVAPSVSLTGPFIIYANTELRYYAYFRGNALVGTGSAAGSSCEFKNSLPFDSVEAPHYNYVDDSILGYHAHMGAGSIASSTKSSRKNIMIRTGDGAIETGFRKIGAALGDYVEMGCGMVLNPGSAVGRNTMIYPLTSVRSPVPANSIVKNTEGIITRQN